MKEFGQAVREHCEQGARDRKADKEHIEKVRAKLEESKAISESTERVVGATMMTVPVAAVASPAAPAVSSSRRLPQQNRYGGPGPRRRTQDRQ